MRDKQRINRIIKDIEKIWMKMPDMRFIQFIIYLYSMIRKNDTTIDEKFDPFYYEDHDLEKTLKRILNE